MSDRGLRRLAWASWWFLPAMVVVGVILSFANQPTTAEYGDNGIAVGEILFLVVVLAFPVTGILILRRQPRNTIGWLLQGIGFVWSLSFFADNYVVYGALVNPGSLPGPEVVAALAAGSWAPPIGLMATFLILLYPNGRLPSPRWRPIAWLSAANIVAVTAIVVLAPGQLEDSSIPNLRNPLGLESAETVLRVFLPVTLSLLAFSVVACAVALVRRYRRSHGVERMQLRWLAAAGALVAATYLITILASLPTSTGLYSDQSPAWVGLLQTVSILSFVLIPTAIGIAVLRHGLYDLDVVINRTLVYGSLSATLAGVYLASVLLLQFLLSPLTDQSDLAVAGSTLAVAALFRPARSRIQSLVDRRFYRSRYDAARTLDAFAGQLRHDLNLDAVGTDLCLAVGETVQPTLVSLWLRPEVRKP
ncbi:MAG: hypothetical protein H0V23_00025 [Nocardioidaceae bacterium]|nr:hypothetical protein [Nocardioidaceae bacterium]